MNTWTQLRVGCKTEDLYEVSAIMEMISSNLLIEDNTEIDRAENIYGELIGEELKTADRTRGAVSLFVSEDEDENEIADLIKERLERASIPYEFSIVKMKEEDWADSWKQYYKPVRIGKKTVVVPLWEDYTPEPGDVIVRMDPGMAFGTGTHETTRLCSSMVEEYMPKGAYVLDIGTGSGILAIVASKHGARHVNAYDIDPVAVRVAKENAAENGCDNIECGVSDLLKDVDISHGLYDFVTANIVADIIVRMAKDVPNYMKPGGLIAVSGIIDTQFERVKDALVDAGLVLVKKEEENDWNALLLAKPV